MECIQNIFVFISLFISVPADVVRRQINVGDNASCSTPNKLLGNCIPITECQSILKFLDKDEPITQQEKEAIRRYRCGSNTEARVCCPKKNFNLDWLYGDCKTPDESIGRCIYILSCKPMMDFLEMEDNISTATATMLKKYICDSDTGNTNVCCPSKPIILRDAYVDTKPPHIDHSRHKNAYLLPRLCGTNTGTDKINKGKEADLYEFPWMAALKLRTGESVGYTCGGTLISNRYILTAAHCIRFKASEIVGVRLGEYNFNTDLDCDVGADGLQYCAPIHKDLNVSIEDAIVHQKFNATTLESDIALIRLREKINFTGFAIAPVCLPITREEKDIEIDFYTVIGWGFTHLNVRSNILLKAQVNSAECTDMELTEGQFCAGGVNEIDVCSGDSGGPLMAEYVEDSALKTIQYGIVSFGPRICGKENFPATYTKVIAYIDWILDNLKP